MAASPKPEKRRKISNIDPYSSKKLFPKYELVLISQSPRRRSLLERAGFLFRVDTVKISEIIEENVNLEQAIMQVARTKAEAYLRANNSLKSHNILLLSADTEVCFEGRALGKPENKSEAQEFLERLSGKTHDVVTGICLINCQNAELVLGHVKTKVWFRVLSKNEIEEYVATGDPMDKAGGYGIQSGGGKFVEKIEGSMDNVIGLPVDYVERVLLEKNWNVERRSN